MKSKFEQTWTLVLSFRIHIEKKLFLQNPLEFSNVVNYKTQDSSRLLGKNNPFRKEIVTDTFFSEGKISELGSKFNKIIIARDP